MQLKQGKNMCGGWGIRNGGAGMVWPGDAEHVGGGGMARCLEWHLSTSTSPSLKPVLGTNCVQIMVKAAGWGVFHRPRRMRSHSQKSPTRVHPRSKPRQNSRFCAKRGLLSAPKVVVVRGCHGRRG